MKINYNKRSPFLQGSGNLVEEVNRAVQMVESGNAENKIEGMILDGKGVGRAYSNSILSANPSSFAFFLAISTITGERSIPLNLTPGMAFDKKMGKVPGPVPTSTALPFSIPLANTRLRTLWQGNLPYRLAMQL